MVRRSLAMLALVALSCATSAYAAPPEDASARALGLFHESARAYRDGRFQDAVDLLLRARELKSEPVLLYNLGRAYEALGKTAEAANAYERYLAEDANAPDRKAVEGRIATLRRQAEEREALRRAETARAKPPSTPPPPPPAPVTVADSAPRSDPLAPVPWVVGSVGAAALGAGVVFGLFARARYDAADGDPAQATAAGKYDEAKRDAVVANIAFAAGAVLIVAAGVWLVVRANTGRPAPAPAALTLAPGVFAF